MLAAGSVDISDFMLAHDDRLTGRPRRFADDPWCARAHLAQCETHLPGERHGFRSTRYEQVPSQEPLDRCARRVDGDHTVGSFHLPNRWAPHHRIDEFDHPVGCLGKGVAQRLGGQHGEFRADIDAGGAEAPGVRSEGISCGAHHPIRIITPHQGQCHQLGHCDIDGIA